ncbi:MAG: hypothetical protein Q4D02_08450 [Clostridia bacterium]|nr:hypothetical protein [Clostridia bacterium]
MRNREYIFIVLNSTIIIILWLIASSGLSYSNNDFLELATLICNFGAIILEFGGEFIIISIYTYKLNYKLDFKVVLFSIIINIVLMKIFLPNIWIVLTVLLPINQIFGMLLGNILLNKKSTKK